MGREPFPSRVARAGRSSIPKASRNRRAMAPAFSAMVDLAVLHHLREIAVWMAEMRLRAITLSVPVSRYFGRKAMVPTLQWAVIWWIRRRLG